MGSETEKCSYCNKKLGKSYSFNSIFVTPTIYKCKRWWCDLFKKYGIFKLKWAGVTKEPPVKKLILRLANKINF